MIYKTNEGKEIHLFTKGWLKDLKLKEAAAAKVEKLKATDFKQKAADAAEKIKNLDAKKVAHDFIYGKPHEERRLGDLYIPGTGLYKHREWRGVKDTMYYFHMIWLYNYVHMVTDIMKYG